MHTRNVYAETYTIFNLQHTPSTSHSQLNSQLPKKKVVFFVTLLSVEYKVKWLHGGFPLLSANCCFCNSHWHGGLAPALPPVLSLAYRPCLTDCQPLGSDSILSWYTVRECSETVMLPGSDGYKIAGRLWKGKKGNKKNYNLPGRTSSKRAEWTRRGATSPYFLLLVLLLGVIDVIDQLEDKGKIYSGRRFSFSPKWRHQWRQPSSSRVL